MIGFYEAELLKGYGHKVGRPEDPAKIKKALEKIHGKTKNNV